MFRSLAMMIFMWVKREHLNKNVRWLGKVGELDFCKIWHRSHLCELNASSNVDHICELNYFSDIALCLSDSAKKSRCTQEWWKPWWGGKLCSVYIADCFPLITSYFQDSWCRQFYQMAHFVLRAHILILTFPPIFVFSEISYISFALLPLTLT